MGEVKDFELVEFAGRILNHQYIDLMNPFLVKEFKIVIENIDKKTWEDIKVKFLQDKDCMFAIDELMCFTIIAFNLKQKFLDIEIDYLEPICNTLLLANKSPLNFLKYANVLTSEEVYSTLFAVGQNLGFEILLDIFQDFYLRYDYNYWTEDECKKFLSPYKKLLNPNNVIELDFKTNSNINKNNDNNCEVIDSFKFKLLTLKQEADDNAHKFPNNIGLMKFKKIIDKYPDRQWEEIKEEYLNKLPLDNINFKIIYTILAYEMGLDFLNNSTIFIYDLIETFCYYKISFFNLEKYTNIFLNEPLYGLIQESINNNLVEPRFIFSLIFDEYNLDCLEKDISAYDEMIHKVKKFMAENSQELFNNNYSFFNVYFTIFELISTKYFDINTDDLDLIPYLESITDENLKRKIKEQIKEIDQSKRSIEKKVEDIILIAKNNCYDTILARRKEPKY